MKQYSEALNRSTFHVLFFEVKLFDCLKLFLSPGNCEFYFFVIITNIYFEAIELIYMDVDC